MEGQADDVDGRWRDVMESRLDVDVMSWECRPGRFGWRTRTWERRTWTRSRAQSKAWLRDMVKKEQRW